MEISVVGVLEFSSIALGMKSLDEMIKIAPIKIIEAKTICPGKYLIIFGGDVASVEFSYTKGIEIGKEYIVDTLFLPQIHKDVPPAIGNIIKIKDWNSIGIIETLSVVSAIEVADVSAKVGGVKIIEVRTAIGFGGKSYVKILGELDDVQAAMESGTEKAKAKNQLFSECVIPRPHAEMKPYFMGVES
jgi:microcompartment protein CcmL/EutN